MYCSTHLATYSLFPAYHDIQFTIILTSVVIREGYKQGGYKTGQQPM